MKNITALFQSKIISIYIYCGILKGLVSENDKTVDDSYGEVLEVSGEGLVEIFFSSSHF
jgi:hypothetical protein